MENNFSKKNNALLTLIQSEFLLFDGGMGSMLQERGMNAGELPELYNITNPALIESIHRAYTASGAQVATTNTFGSNALKLKDSGYSVEEIVTAGVKIAKNSGAKFTALDLGPLGSLMQPMGTLTFDQAYDLFKQQVIAGERAGADLVIIETIADLYEAKAAILAVKENSDLPVFCTLSYQEDRRTFTGTDPVTGTITLQALGVDALGVNCSLGPKELMPIVEKIAQYAKVPMIVQPNAGLPKIVDDQTVYDITPEEFGHYIKQMLALGVTIIGGCCGTNTAMIAKLSSILAASKPVRSNPRIVSAATSGSKTVILDEGVSVIGERINPTGKKKLKEALREGRMDYIISEAIDQTAAGADILDINVGLPEIDESQTLTKVIFEVQSVSNLPLQIDSSDSAAIASAARIYNGKPIINSVNGKTSIMKEIFPIVKKYGALIIGLTLDEEGIPATAEGRFNIAKKIYETALSYQIPEEDIIIDCLVLTASAQQDQVIETLRAITLVKQRLGLKTTLGVSNVSFGLPQREMLNCAFLASAFGAGLDAPILNPLSNACMQTVHAFRVINNQDRNADHFIQLYGADTNTVAASAPAGTQKTLQEIIIEGRKDESAPKVVELLKTRDALDIINEAFIPALDIVGAKYEKGEIFLPQLIVSAETVKKAFEVIHDYQANNNTIKLSKGKILIATVQGDIHDIGKNIVKMLLENYGYDVVDLGKDVPIAHVCETARKQNIKLVALSALMTTTVKNMKLTIDELKAQGHECAVMVGGAVLNPEYAALVGATYYAKDARQSVAIAQEFFGVADYSN